MGERPHAAHQRLTRLGRRWRSLDQRDDLIDIGQRDSQTFEYVAALARFAQLEHRAPRDHFAPVPQELLEHLLQVHQARLAVDQRHHVDPEGVLHLRFLEQIIEDHFGHLAALQLDHAAHAGFIRFVANLGDAFEPLFAHHVADLAKQRRLVHLVGQLVDDDRLASALVDVFEVRARAHDEAAAARAIAFEDAGGAVDDASRREIGALHDARSGRRSPCPVHSAARGSRSMTSARLCGGILVAIPTAIPEEPLISRFGSRAGNTTGSSSLPS